VDQPASVDSRPAVNPSRLVRVAAPLRQEMTNRLRDAILAFDYAPAGRLVERELCDRFGVSRTVVREALRQLESEGLVTMVPNRGPVVAVLTPGEAAAIFEVRAALEALAAELFARRADEPTRHRLTEAVATIATAFQSDDQRAWLRAKDDYYDVLFAGAGNDFIRSTVQGLHARVQTLRRLSLNARGRQPETLREVTAIAEAAVRGDADAARDAARLHVERAAVAALGQLAVAAGDNDE